MPESTARVPGISLYKNEDEHKDLLSVFSPGRRVRIRICNADIISYWLGLEHPRLAKIDFEL